MGLFSFLFKKTIPNPDFTEDIMLDGKVIGYKYNAKAFEANKWEPPVFTAWCKTEADRKYHWYQKGKRMCDGAPAPSNRIKPTFSINPSDGCKKCLSKTGYS